MNKKKVQGDTTTPLTSWTLHNLETEPGWQPSQWHERCFRAQRCFASLHPITGHIRELQRCHLWGETVISINCTTLHPLADVYSYKSFNVVLYFLQGDWAWLKRLPDGTFSSINPKTTNIFELVCDTVVRQSELVIKQHKSWNITKSSWEIKVKLHLCGYRWRTCVMRISTLSWASFTTVASSPLWPNSAPGEVWRTFCWTTTSNWTGCSSHLCY